VLMQLLLEGEGVLLLLATLAEAPSAAATPSSWADWTALRALLLLLLFLKSDERCHEVSREGGGLLTAVGGLVRGAPHVS